MMHSLNIKFKKDYYQDTKIDADGNVSILPCFKTMYHLSITKDYFLDSKEKVLKEVINDLQQEIEILKSNSKEIEGR